MEEGLEIVGTDAFVNFFLGVAFCLSESLYLLGDTRKLLFA